MANQVEPMDVDDLETGFDNKENTYNSNVLPKGSSTEKGYEELDVSEIRKLRYSFTPTSSSMSKSYTGNCTYTMDSVNNEMCDSGSLVRSLGPISLNDTMLKSTKPLGVKTISSDNYINRSLLAQNNLERTHTLDDESNVVTSIDTNGNDDISNPGSSISTFSTPITITPTKELSKPTSPIMRGLKSVLNMFRQSQSPSISDDADCVTEPDITSGDASLVKNLDVTFNQSQAFASTPIANKRDESLSKRNSPLKDSIVFKEDLVNELQWNDDSTIIFSHEKIPIHKLFLPQTTALSSSNSSDTFENTLNQNEELKNNQISISNIQGNLNVPISYNDLTTMDQTISGNNYSQLGETALLDDIDNSQFVDCETSFDVNNESELLKSYNEFLDTDNIQDGVVDQNVTLTAIQDVVNDEVISLSTKIIVEKDDNITENISSDTENKTVVKTIQANITYEFIDKNIINPAMEIVQEIVNNKRKKLENNFNTESSTKLERGDELQDDTTLEAMEPKQILHDSLVQQNATSIIAEKGNSHELTHLKNGSNNTTELEVSALNNVTDFLNETQDISSILKSVSTLTNVDKNQEKALTSPLLNYNNNNEIVDNIELKNNGIINVTLETNVTTVETASLTVEESTLKAIDESINKTIETVSSTTADNTYTGIVEMEQIVNNSEGQNILNKDSSFPIVLTSVNVEGDTLSSILNTFQQDLGENVNKIIGKNLHAVQNMDDSNQSFNEEIVASEISSLNNENNSTVSIDFKAIDNPFETKTRIRASPLNSPNMEISFVDIEKPLAISNKMTKSPLPINNLKKSNQQIKKDCTLLTEICADVLNKHGEISSSEYIDHEYLGKFSNNEKKAFELTKNIDGNHTSIHDTETEIVIPKEEQIELPIKTVPKTDISEENVDLNHGKESTQIFEFITGRESKIHCDNITSTVESENKCTAKSQETTDIPFKKSLFSEQIVNELLEVSQNFDKNTENINNKYTSSSEQSVYLSAETSSVEEIESKEIKLFEDLESIINPFTTKTKLRQSLDLGQISENTLVTDETYRISPIDTAVLTDAEEVTETNNVAITESSLSDISENANETVLENVIQSSEVGHCDVNKSSESRKSSELNTEDEDTVEGPFLEMTCENAELIDGTNVNNQNEEFNAFTDTNLQNDEEFQNEEMFIDAEAFDFLMNKNSNTILDNGKESLFLKFDPLCANKVNSDGIAAALSKIQKCQNSPCKMMPLKPTEMQKFQKESSQLNLYFGDEKPEESPEEQNITISQKPTMAVMPAVNSATTVHPRNKSSTPPRSNRQSMTVTSPAIAVIDRLLSLSSNNSPVVQNMVVTENNREQEETLKQLRQILAEKEQGIQHLHTESSELRSRLTTLETQITVLETSNKDKIRKINDLNERLAEKTKMNKNMASVVEEYERTIAGLIADTEIEKKRNTEEKTKLIKERDEQTAHLASMEVSFSDLHSKYEKSKQIILTYKANEDLCKKSIAEYDERLKKMQNIYEQLKQHATAQLNNANQELEKMNKAHESEVLKLNAMIKRKELHITSLEETLIQKTKANEELTAICDELINKVG